MKHFENEFLLDNVSFCSILHTTICFANVDKSTRTFSDYNKGFFGNYPEEDYVCKGINQPPLEWR